VDLIYSEKEPEIRSLLYPHTSAHDSRGCINGCLSSLCPHFKTTWLAYPVPVPQLQEGESASVSKRSRLNHSCNNELGAAERQWGTRRAARWCAARGGWGEQRWRQGLHETIITPSGPREYRKAGQLEARVGRRRRDGFGMQGFEWLSVLVDLQQDNT